MKNTGMERPEKTVELEVLPPQSAEDILMCLGWGNLLFAAKYPEHWKKYVRWEKNKGHEILMPR